MVSTVAVQVLQSAGETDMTFQSRCGSGHFCAHELTDHLWEQALSEAHCASVLVSPCEEGRD